MDRHIMRHLKPRQKALIIVTIAQQTRRPRPFANADENASYGHLAGLCAERGMDLHVTHYHHLVGIESTFAWVWRDGAWQPIDLALSEVALCYADLPENDPKTHPFRQAFEVHPIKVVNAVRLSDLLTDKLATHAFFDGMVPSTWSADAPDLMGRLNRRPLHPDLATQKLFLKPRFGERGRDIHVIDRKGFVVPRSMRNRDYILQAFLETNHGFPELGIHGRHDVRLILRDGEIMLAFARVPEEGSYVSNCSRGGREIPLGIQQLPERLRQFATEVDTLLSDFGPRLYSLDVGVGRSGKLWIYELNTMPGIVWDSQLHENKPMHQEMHGIVADWLAKAAPEALPLPRIVSMMPTNDVVSVRSNWPSSLCDVGRNRLNGVKSRYPPARH